MQTVFEATYPEDLYLIAPKVTVVLPVPWAEVKEEEKALLAKILTAVKLSLDAVVIRHQPKFDLSVWAEKPSKVLCFAQADGLPKFEVLPAQNTSVVVSLPLPELMTNDDAKKKLWGALRVMFR
jgi:DNA polymerase III psi subunit